MGSILGDFFKNIGSGVDKITEGNILDGIGKIVGGTLDGAGRTVGFAAKAIGSVASSVGDALSDSDNDEETSEIPKEDLEVVGIITHIGLLAKMAKMDGRVSRKEINFMTELMTEWRVDDEGRTKLEQTFREMKSSDESIYELAELFCNAYVDDVDTRVSVYIELWRMAIADDSGAEEKLEVLRSIPQFLSLKDEIFYEVSAALQADAQDGNGGMQTVEDCYAVLGCSPDASNAEVKRCYKQQMSQYHPDAISGKDLAPAFIEFANQQAARINAAYETIKTERGMR